MKTISKHAAFLPRQVDLAFLMRVLRRTPYSLSLPAIAGFSCAGLYQPLSGRARACSTAAIEAARTTGGGGGTGIARDEIAPLLRGGALSVGGVQ